MSNRKRSYGDTEDPIAMPTSAASPDSLTRLLLDNATRRADRPAVREKSRGIWKTSTWRELADDAKAIAAALAAAGFERGEHAAVLGDNRPRQIAAMAAVHALGGVVVPLYEDAAADELVEPLVAAGVTHVFAEDQEQVDKLLAILPSCPALRSIVYDQDRGMRHYRQPQLHAYAELQERGRGILSSQPALVESRAQAVRAEDAATLLFVPRGDGPAKGVVLSHGALVDRARAVAAADDLGEDDVSLSYLPPAWPVQHLLGYAVPLATGGCVCCPESSETMLHDLRDIGPTRFFAPPRVLRAIENDVSIRMADAGRAKRAMYRRAVELGRSGGTGGGLTRSALEMLVLGPLRDVLGMSRLKVAYTGGIDVPADVLSFFRGLGVNLKRLYGTPETGALIAMHPDGRVDPETVGVATRGVELRVDENGELLVRSPGVFLGYHGDSEATSRVLGADGWCRTGDLAEIGADGALRVVDRVRDVVALGDGTRFSPARVERLLKGSPYVKEAVALAAGRDAVCALVCVDPVAAGDWAERRGIAYTGYADLASRSEVHDLVAECVSAVNDRLARDPATAGSQVRRFVVMQKEIGVDDGALTRTGELRRPQLHERCRPLIEALLGGRAAARLDEEVVHEDGRVETVSTELRIRDARTAGTDLRKAA
jgi:long-chain acyl-CoA synthetase